MFPERLRALRHGKGITLEELASELNQRFPTDPEHENTSNQIGNWERGIRTPSYLEVKKLAEYFDVTMDYLSGVTNNNSYDLSKLFLSGNQIKFFDQVLSSDDRYEVYQLIDGYMHGRVRRVTSNPTINQEELDLNFKNKSN